MKKVHSRKLRVHTCSSLHLVTCIHVHRWRDYTLQFYARVLLGKCSQIKPVKDSGKRGRTGEKKDKVRRPGSTENVGHGWHHGAANLEAKEADCPCALLSLAKGGPAGRCGVLSDLSK